MSFTVVLKIVNATLKVKAKSWTFEAKAIKFGFEAPGLEDYITDLSQARNIQLAMIQRDNISTTSTVPGQIVIRVLTTNRVLSCIRLSAPILRDDASEKSRLWSSRTRPMR